MILSKPRLATMMLAMMAALLMSVLPAAAQDASDIDTSEIPEMILGNTDCNRLQY